MEKSKKIELSSILPVLTVICTFAVVGMILSSVIGDRDERLAESAPASDVSPEISEAVVIPEEETVLTPFED